VFCCIHATPPGGAGDTVAVPCACRLGPGVILEALAAGAGSVQVVGCGPRCRTLDGARIVARRLQTVADTLAVLGIDPARVQATDGSGSASAPEGGTQ
jgi:coenzyme F420-reducing hydrogenase delta subunit